MPRVFTGWRKGKGARRMERAFVARRACGHSRSLPVAHRPMTLVILNMCVTSDGSTSLSCHVEGHAIRFETERQI